MENEGQDARENLIRRNVEHIEQLYLGREDLGDPCVILADVTDGLGYSFGVAVSGREYVDRRKGREFRSFPLAQSARSGRAGQQGE